MHATSFKCKVANTRAPKILKKILKNFRIVCDVLTTQAQLSTQLRSMCVLLLAFYKRMQTIKLRQTTENNGGPCT